MELYIENVFKTVDKKKKNNIDQNTHGYSLYILLLYYSKYRNMVAHSFVCSDTLAHPLIIL